MKRIIHRIPLIAGCLFLAWVMVLLAMDVTDHYQERQVLLSETESSFSSEADVGWFDAADGDGLRFILNSFIYAHNDCGFYDREWAYLNVGKITEEEVQSAYMELYLIFVFLLAAPIIICGIRLSEKVSFYEVLHSYLLSGIFLGMVLLVGRSPSYKGMILLVTGWIYMNLARSWLEMGSQQKPTEFLQRFPKGLVFCYVGLLLLFLAMPVFMPVEKLPEVNEEAKNAVFAKLQDFHLVTSQYEENIQKNLEKQRKDEEEQSTNFEITEDETEEDGIDEEDTSGDGMEGDESDRNEPNGAGEDDGNEESEIDENETGGSEISGSGNGTAGSEIGGSGIAGSGTNGSGIGGNGTNGSGVSSGGISGGRTDRTGNLQLEGKTVLTVYSSYNPGQNIYIRLFYAEDYEENRWKQTKKSGNFPVYYKLQNEQVVNEVMELEYAGADSERISFGHSIVLAELYPEEGDYLTETCRAVPGSLAKVLEAEFPQVFGTEAASLSEEEAVLKIEQLLEKRAYYTLSPGKVPEQEDFITWFLTEKKCGYCMHFASAGVMMLRQAGISSRYAEGYVVPASAWKQDEDGRWYAEVLDKNAHAWAEVYTYNGGNSGPGYWKPVEMTPAYDGELVNSFAGQNDQYVGRLVIPGVVIKLVKWILKAAGMVLLVVLGLFLYKKGVSWYEYRMLHTGSRNRDVQNMMKLLLDQSARNSSELKNVLKKENLSREEFIEKISDLITKTEADEKIAADIRKWFVQLSDYVYQAAFGKVITRQQRVEALCLYGKLKHRLFSKKRLLRQSIKN